jgi:hypothetical protein
MCRFSRQRFTTLQIDVSPEYDRHHVALAFAAALPFLAMASAVTSLLGMA